MNAGNGKGQQRPGTLTREQVADLYFIEHRAKLLDLASFLDRAERAPAAGQEKDVRYAVFERALGVLADGKPERARRALEIMSDPTPEPIEKAGVKGAIGVWPKGPNEPGAERAGGMGGRG
jgi:hypothetical protein